MAGIDWSERPVALVTGAAGGIGAASARALARRGARVALLDLDEGKGRTVAAEIGGTFLRADVTSPSEWAGAVDRITAELGTVTIGHLNAGVMTLPPTAGFDAAADLVSITEAAYRRIVAVNVDGIVLGLRALLPGMQEKGVGSIVVTASIGGLTPVPFDPLYAMTKHALVGLVRSLAPTLAARGIGLAAICPGGVDTALVPDYVRTLGFPLLAPDEVAGAVVTLVETASSGGVFVVRAGQPEPQAFAEPAIDLA